VLKVDGYWIKQVLEKADGGQQKQRMLLSLLRMMVYG
jgi:hypothetical protein